MTNFNKVVVFSLKLQIVRYGAYQELHGIDFCTSFLMHAAQQDSNLL